MADDSDTVHEGAGNAFESLESVPKQIGEMKTVYFPPRKVLSTDPFEARDCPAGLLRDLFHRLTLDVAVAPRPDILGHVEIAARKRNPDAHAWADTIRHGLARDAGMVDDMAMIALRPSRVLLRAPHAVHAH